MPDVFYKVVKSITQPPRLVEIKNITIIIEAITVNNDGTRVFQEPQTKTETHEKWLVKAMVDKEWVGVFEEEFFFPSEAACAVIQPGYKEAF